MTTLWIAQFVCLFSLGLFGTLSEAQPVLETNRRTPVDGLPLELTCKLRTSSPSQLHFRSGPVSIVNCTYLNSSSCDYDESRFSVTYNSSQMEMTLEIQSFDPDVDNATWNCIHGYLSSNNVSLLTSSSNVEISEITASLTRANLSNMIYSNETKPIVLTTPCAKGTFQVEWTYSSTDGSSGTLTPSNSPAICATGLAGVVSVYILEGSNPIMTGKLVTINISLEHDSFPPENGYTTAFVLGPIQFPVPVESVTLGNLSSDGEFLQVLTNTDLKLVCQTPGSFPASVITWYKNDRLVTSGVLISTVNVTSVVMQAMSTITVRVSKDNNNDKYHCKASNGFTEKTSFSATLNVLYPPSKPVISLPGYVLEGREVNLTCQSSDRGNPVCEYTWRKSNAVQNVGQNLLFIPLMNDSGAVMTCEAFNEYTNMTATGVSSDPVTLNVYFRPRVSISPRSASHSEGNVVILMCSALSNPTNPSFKWTFSSSSNVIGTSAELRLSGLTRAQHGNYTCTANVHTTEGDLTGSDVVQVTVNYAPDIHMQNKTASEGDNLLLQCEASGRPNTYTFRSFKHYWGSVYIRSVAGSKTGFAYIYQVPKASYQDMGQYQCEVQNGIADTNGNLYQTKTVGVAVEASPVPITKTSSYGVELGKSINISQSWYAFPNVSSQRWTLDKNGVVTFPFSLTSTVVSLPIRGRVVNVQGYRTELRVNNVQQKDYGVYRETMCNRIGCTNSTFYLRADGPPLVPLDFAALNSSAESVWLKWKSNFPGGNYIQNFILYYRPRGSGANWTKESVLEGPGNITYKRVLGLLEGTEYAFKLQPINNRRSNNIGPFTDEVYQKTKGLEGSGLSVGVGIGIGASIGFMLLLVGGALIFKFRRKLSNICSSILRPKRKNRGGDQVDDADSSYDPIELNTKGSERVYDQLNTANSKSKGTEENPYVNSKFRHQKPAILPKPDLSKLRGDNHDGHIYQNC